METNKNGNKQKWKQTKIETRSPKKGGESPKRKEKSKQKGEIKDWNRKGKKVQIEKEPKNMKKVWLRKKSHS